MVSTIRNKQQRVKYSFGILAILLLIIPTNGQPLGERGGGQAGVHFKSPGLENRETILPSTEKEDSDIGSLQNATPNPIKLILKNNREVKAAEFAFQAALEKVKVAGTLPDPKIESNLYQYPIETKNGPIEAQLMLGQKFPLWGKLSRERSIAVLEAEIAALKLEFTKIMVVYKMRKGWENYLRLKNSLDILDRYRGELETFRTIALTQYSTGAGMTQHPILKLQIEISLIESQINTLQSNYESVTNNLQSLFDGSFTPGLFEDQRTAVLSIKTPDFWLDLAQKTHPRYKQAQREVQIAVLQNELATRQNYPDLVTGLTYTAIGDGPSVAPDPGADALGIKIGINLPLWFKRNRARVESTKLRVGSKGEMVEEIWNRIEDDILSTKKELMEVEETYSLYTEKLIQESEQMLSSAYAAYETGKISFLDLLDSERMVVRIRLEFEAVEAKRRIASANMIKDIGLINFTEE